MTAKGAGPSWVNWAVAYQNRFRRAAWIFELGDRVRIVNERFRIPGGYVEANVTERRQDFNWGPMYRLSIDDIQWWSPELLEHVR
jgi:hypothetical protein